MSFIVKGFTGCKRNKGLLGYFTLDICMKSVKRAELRAACLGILTGQRGSVGKVFKEVRAKIKKGL